MDVLEVGRACCDGCITSISSRPMEMFAGAFA